jgi:hypothetical protein
MTAQAAIARTNAVHFEAKKDGCTQRQSGDWVIRLTVQSLDLDQAVMRAAPGTRYMVALVEIGDDEQPVQQQKEPAASSKTQIPTAQPRQSTPAGAPQTYAKRLGMACTQPRFWMFMFEHTKRQFSVTNEEEAANVVRNYLGCKRRDTIVNTPAGNKARDLLADFDVWTRGILA